VIGCGNLARSDDGAGVEVIRELTRRGFAEDASVKLIDAGTGGMDVMFAARGAQRVLIIDACRSGSEPGAIFRMPGREAQTPAEHGFSLHGLRWDHALFAGCRIFGDSFVDNTEVILIEAQLLGFGLDMSEPVKRAVNNVVTLLAEEMNDTR
jgi:hydrogenase maturation protease